MVALGTAPAGQINLSRELSAQRDATALDNTHMNKYGLLPLDIFNPNHQIRAEQITPVANLPP